MTCHVGVSGPGGSLILCDSQLSTQTSEIHGAQKLYAGEGFVIGGAGLALVIMDLFAELGSMSTNATSVGSAVETYIETGLSDKARWRRSRSTSAAVKTSSTGQDAPRRRRGVCSGAG